MGSLCNPIYKHGCPLGNLKRPHMGNDPDRWDRIGMAKLYNRRPKHKITVVGKMNRRLTLLYYASIGRSVK